MPLCDARVVLPSCTIVHATSSVPHTYAICPSPPMFFGVTTNFVICVAGAFGGNQYSFNPFCPIRGVSPCGGNNTQSSVNRARTPSASPLSQACSYLVCTSFIFSMSSGESVLPPPARITGARGGSTLSPEDIEKIKEVHTK